MSSIALADSIGVLSICDQIPRRSHRRTGLKGLRNFVLKFDVSSFNKATQKSQKNNIEMAITQLFKKGKFNKNDIIRTRQLKT